MPYLRSIREYDETLIDRNDEYYEFLHTLKNYHKRRGTLSFFVPEPSISNVKISLLRIFKEVTDKGGYDSVSCTTGLWKQMANDYGIPDMSNSGYLLKNIYYKNLAAYEIEYHWNKEPPPPNILEHLTARGGDILQRTEEWQTKKHLPPPEDYDLPISQPPPTRIVSKPPISPLEFYKSSNRVVLPKRYAPLQSSFVQSASSSQHFATATIPPSQLNPIAVVLDPVEQQKKAQQHLPRPAIGIASRPSLERIQLAIRSQLKSEQVWALDVLLHEAAKEESVRLEENLLLAEALLELVIEALKIAGESEPALLQQKETFSKLEFGVTAALILRNCSIDKKNAATLAGMKQTQQMGKLMLQIKDLSAFIEIFNYCSTILEAASEEMQLNNKNDDLYLALKTMLDSDDRSILVSGLKVLARLASNDEWNLILQDMTIGQINRILLLLESQDEMIVKAALEFLYQFTTYKHGTDTICRQAKSKNIINTFRRLILFNAQPSATKLLLSNEGIRQSTSAKVLEVSREHVVMLLKYLEPERSLRWLLLLLEADPDSYVLQSTLWDSYNLWFTKSDICDGNKISPTELIDGIPSVFPYAEVTKMQFSNGEHLVIQGIRPRQKIGRINDQKFCLVKRAASNTNQGNQYSNTELATEEEVNNIEKRDLKLIYSYLLSSSKDGSLQGYQPEKNMSLYIEQRKSQVDENGEPMGIPLLAALVLKNIVKSKKILNSVEFEIELLQLMTLCAPFCAHISEMLCEL